MLKSLLGCELVIEKISVVVNIMSSSSHLANVDESSDGGQGSSISSEQVLNLLFQTHGTLTTATTLLQQINKLGNVSGNTAVEMTRSPLSASVMPIMKIVSNAQNDVQALYMQIQSRNNQIAQQAQNLAVQSKQVRSEIWQ